jgi:geranylgeranyl diphosphate synthase type II
MKFDSKMKPDARFWRNPQNMVADTGCLPWQKRVARSVPGFWEYAKAHRASIESALEQNLPLAHRHVGSRFNGAVRYAVFPGGKRLRPILTMLGAELFGLSGADVINAAVAVEYVHTSSLILDDMPAMDDASERRGRPPLHKAFGEDIATLVAIGLLNSSYRLATLDANGNRSASLRAVFEIVDCVGPAGMVGGQTADLALAHPDPFEDTPAGLGAAQSLKTSALIRLALRLGAIYSGADEDSLSALTCFAKLLGEAYQIRDDITDVREDSFRLKSHPQPSNAELLQTIAKARNLLEANFPESSARHCLSELVNYIAA